MKVRMTRTDKNGHVLATETWTEIRFLRRSFIAELEMAASAGLAELTYKWEDGSRTTWAIVS